MGMPAEFCRNARECAELAKQTNNEVHRKILLDLAAKWLHLAGATRHEIELIRTADKQTSD
jgi:hypothetical protein